MTGVLVSAARKSSGKTAFSVGLAASLHCRGHRVQTFKKGPDYIDPMWLSKSSHRPCINLDFYTMSHGEIEHTFHRCSEQADSVIVEGNKGLHDGLDVFGSDSNAALAKLLDLPVILLIDASGITRGVAPLIHGYSTFDQQVRIGGVVLNNVAGARHERKLRAAIEHYTDVPVLGAIPRSDAMRIEERHIGLVPSSEDEAAQRRVEGIAHAVASAVDLDKILQLATGPAAAPATAEAGLVSVDRSGVRIGVAKDEAFGFYYPDDLELMTRLGARVVYFDTLRDPALPDIDALFLGGGFPEFHLDRLAGNTGLKADIARFVHRGCPVYAECGGLMYLCRDITFMGNTRSMVGVIQGNAVMTDSPVGRGYVQLRETAQHPWPPFGRRPAGALPAHEFHYSRLQNLGDEVSFAYTVERGTGIQDRRDGLVYKNVLAMYSHQRNVGPNRWVERFVAHASRCKSDRDYRQKAAV